MDNSTVLNGAEAIPKTAAIVVAMAKAPELYALVESYFAKQSLTFVFRRLRS